MYYIEYVQRNQYNTYNKLGRKKHLLKTKLHICERVLENVTFFLQVFCYDCGRPLSDQKIHPTTGVEQLAARQLRLSFQACSKLLQRQGLTARNSARQGQACSMGLKFTRSCWWESWVFDVRRKKRGTLRGNRISQVACLSGLMSLKRIGSTILTVMSQIATWETEQSPWPEYSKMNPYPSSIERERVNKVNLLPVACSQRMMRPVAPCFLACAAAWHQSSCFIIPTEGFKKCSKRFTKSHSSYLKQKKNNGSSNFTISFSSTKRK